MFCDIEEVVKPISLQALREACLQRFCLGAERLLLMLLWLSPSRSHKSEACLPSFFLFPCGLKCQTIR